MVSSVDPSSTTSTQSTYFRAFNTTDPIASPSSWHGIAAIVFIFFGQTSSLLVNVFSLEKKLLCAVQPARLMLLRFPQLNLYCHRPPRQPYPHVFFAPSTTLAIRSSSLCAGIAAIIMAIFCPHTFSFFIKKRKPVLKEKNIGFFGKDFFLKEMFVLRKHSSFSIFSFFRFLFTSLYPILSGLL